MLRVDAIFFDVDGTLVDARRDIFNAISFIFKTQGLKEKPFGEVVSYIGTGVKDLVAKSIGSGDETSIEKGIKLFEDYYTKHPADEARLYPHVREILHYFKDKRKFILTNRYSRFAAITLDKMGIDEYFESILGGDDENCLKPSACILDSFIPQSRIDKDKTIIVGDMAIDIMTGKNSGIKTCWVSYGLGKVEDVRDLKPDFIIDDILKLKGVIK